MKLKLPENEVILYVLAVAQTFNVARAFIVYAAGSDLLFKIFSVVVGVLLGGALSFGVALAAQKAPRIKAVKARWLAYGAGAVLLVLMPIIVAPAFYVSLPLIFQDPYRCAVAVACAMAPDVVAVLIAAQSAALQAADKSDAAPATAQNRTPRKRAAQAAAVRRCTEPGCGMSFAWPNGKGAHYKRYHRPVKVDQSLLISKK